MIRIKNLSAGYFGKPVIEKVTMEFQPGKVTVLTGPNGSGKSTLIQHMNGLVHPTEGRVTADGADLVDKDVAVSVRQRVGLVFQYPENQLFATTVYDDVAFGPRNMKLPEEEVARRVEEALALVGLSVDEIGERSPFDLSGGQKRRVAIAGVIAMEPRVLVLDEPTAGLDPSGSARILDNIRTYHQEKNACIILVSHSMEEVAREAGRLVVIHKGAVPFSGPPEEVFAHGDELEAMGLGVPAMTKVFARLRSMGVDVPPSVYTIPQAREAILAALHRGPRKAALGLCGERTKEPADMDVSTPPAETEMEQASSDEKGVR